MLNQRDWSWANAGRRARVLAGTARTGRRAGAIAALTLLWLAPGALASTVTVPFTSQGTSTWTVPSGITQINVTAVGGAGGYCSTNGGEGAQVSAPVAVHAGDTLSVVVAGPGGACPGNGAGAPGYGGGGAGAAGTGGYGGGAGGGGASSVSDTTSGTALVFAGGGGGSGYECTGANAGVSDQSCPGNEGGGAGGTSGGAAGANATPGSAGAGGAAGVYSQAGGGGGGGGYFGGGGGSYGAGGGGGSSYTPAGESAGSPVSTAAEVVITYQAAISQVSTNTLVFPAAKTGSLSASETVTLTDPLGAGDPPLVVSSASIGAPGGDADQFRISSDGCTGVPLTAGSSCTVAVRYAPTAEGPAAATLNLADNTASGSEAIALSGAALPAPATGLSFSATADPVFGTGLNGNGQLGTGGTSNTTVPTAMASGAGSFVSVASGCAFSLGLKADGTVWAWGQNQDGQLGVGSTTDAHTPVQVPLPGGMIAIAAGCNHGLALRSDGTVWAWGDNTNRELGVSNVTQSDLPLQVPGLPRIVTLAAGKAFSLGLASDGTVWGWGAGASGQLGDGFTEDSVANPVLGLSGVTGIAAGSSHALAVLSSGAVYAWGSGSLGQLGNNSTSNQTVPVQATGISTAVAVAAGSAHSLALLSNGTVDAWGYNASGQLGVHGTTSSKVAALIPGLTGVAQIGAGLSYSAAVSTAGQLSTWGSNANGQLGLGNTTSVTSPTSASAAGSGVQVLGEGSQASNLEFVAQPHANLSTTLLDFPNEAVGTISTSLPVTVTNKGLVALHIGQATISGSDGDQFAVAGDGCSTRTVAPGASCEIDIRYDAKISNTPVAWLQIPSDSPTSPDLVKLDPPTAGSDAGSPAAGTGSPANPATGNAPPAAGVKRPAKASLSCRRARGHGHMLRLSCTASIEGRLTVRVRRGHHILLVARARLHGTPVVLQLRVPARARANGYEIVATLGSARWAHAVRGR